MFCGQGFDNKTTPTIFQNCRAHEPQPRRDGNIGKGREKEREREREEIEDAAPLEQAWDSEGVYAQYIYSIQNTEYITTIDSSQCTENRAQYTACTLCTA